MQRCRHFAWDIVMWKTMSSSAFQSCKATFNLCRILSNRYHVVLHTSCIFSPCLCLPGHKKLLYLGHLSNLVLDSRLVSSIVHLNRQRYYCITGGPCAASTVIDATSRNSFTSRTRAAQTSCDRSCTDQLFKLFPGFT